MGGRVGPVVRGAWISSLTYISQLYPFLSGLRKTDWKSSTHTKIIKPNKHGKMVLGTQQACVLPRLEGQFQQSSFSPGSMPPDVVTALGVRRRSWT